MLSTPAMPVCPCSRYVTEFRAVRDLGGFDSAKPISIRQSIRQLQEQLGRMSHGVNMQFMPQAAAAGSSRPHPARAGSSRPSAAGAAGSSRQAESGPELQQQGDETAGGEAAGEEQQEQHGPAEQQQQQQPGGQVFLTPGGHAHAEQDLLGGFTPQVRPQPWRLGGGCALALMHFTALSTPNPV